MKTALNKQISSKDIQVDRQMDKQVKRQPILQTLLIAALALSLPFSLAACGNNADDSAAVSSSAGASSGYFEPIPDAESDSSASESSEDISDSSFPYTVGRLTLQIPNYYTSQDDSSGTFIYEESIDSGSIFAAADTNASISESTFRNSEDKLVQRIKDSMDLDLSIGEIQDGTYQDLPAFSADATATVGSETASGTILFVLDEPAQSAYLFLFLKYNEPEVDVLSDYNNMLKTAVLSDTTASAKDGSAASSVLDESSDSASSASSSDSAGVSPDLKAALDSYEEMMDEYCDFMVKYQSADSADMLSMLSDYSDMLEKYSEAMDSLNKLDTDSMSTADYQYYLDVTTRVSKRLLEVAG